MLRAGNFQQQKADSRPWNLLIFSVGGRSLAAKADEVAGISAWKEPVPVSSRTQFVSAVIRQDQAVLPVFDLADLLHVSVQGEQRLCLVAKHHDGAMAICIDEQMPVLQTLDRTAVRPYRGGEFCATGSFSIGLDEIPIISLTELGVAV